MSEEVFTAAELAGAVQSSQCQCGEEKPDWFFCGACRSSLHPAMVKALDGNLRQWCSRRKLGPPDRLVGESIRLYSNCLDWLRWTFDEAVKRFLEKEKGKA